MFNGCSRLLVGTFAFLLRLDGTEPAKYSNGSNIKLSKVLIGTFYLEYTYLIYWCLPHCQWERKYGTENCKPETTKGVISEVIIPGRDINNWILDADERRFTQIYWLISQFLSPFFSVFLRPILKLSGG